MLENKNTLLPAFDERQDLRVICIGFEEPSLDELDRLLGTLDAKAMSRYWVPLRKIHPGTYLGSGKLAEIAEEVLENRAEFAVIDTDLSPNQLKNIEKILGIPTIDRAGIILEIFSRHAQTKEAKTQVELARTEYLLPRLTHFWNHFERQRGGGVGNRGMGEKQLEVDRRLLQKRMSLLKRRLETLGRHRVVQRKLRSDILKVALVGYTNAGKSTLLNALTQSRVLSEDKLFATLDSSARALDPDSHPPVVAIDTVGFIRNIPTHLIASFRSTLEELHEADLLVHVVDSSSPEARQQYEVTEKTLEELDLREKPRVTVFNKVDLVSDPGARNRLKILSPGARFVSALDSSEVEKLRRDLLNHFKSRLELWEVTVPHDQSRLQSKLYEFGSVERVNHIEKGTFFRVRISKEWAEKLELNRFR